MIINAALIKRMPASLGVFDYLVPKKWESRVMAGSLVCVPFRSHSEQALVLQKPWTSHVPISQCKEILSIIGNQPILLTQHLDLASWLAHNSFSSLATVVHALIPDKPKQVAWDVKTTPFKAQKASYTNTIFHNAERLVGHLLDSFTSATSASQALCLVPDKISMKYLGGLMPRAFRHRLILYDAMISLKQKFDIWQSIRNGKPLLVIGTRSALLLPFVRLEKICLYREDDISYQFIEQHPDVDAIILAKELAKLHEASLESFSSTPRLDTFKEYAPLQAPMHEAKPLAHIRIIDRNQFAKKQQSSFLPDDLLEYLAETPKPIAIIYNRQGYAKHRRCKDCGWEPTCPTCASSDELLWQTQIRYSCIRCGSSLQAPSSCQRCGGVRFSTLAPGTARIASELLKKVPGVPIQIIDKDAGHALASEPGIIIGTSFATARIPWEHIHAVVILDADMQLSFPDFRVEERFIQKVRWIVSRLSAGASCLIVTSQPNRPIMHALQANAWQAFFRKMLSERKRFSLPPFAYMCIAKPLKKNVSLSPEEFASRMERLPDSHMRRLTWMPIQYKSRSSFLIRIPLPVAEKTLQSIAFALQEYSCMPTPIDLSK